MDVKEEQHGVCEAVGVFHQVADLQAAIFELLNSGFDRAEISILGSQDAVEAKLGTTEISTTDLEDNPSTPRGLYVSNESMEVGKGSLIGGLALLGGLASTIVLTATDGPILCTRQVDIRVWQARTMEECLGFIHAYFATRSRPFIPEWNLHEMGASASAA